MRRAILLSMLMLAACSTEEMTADGGVDLGAADLGTGDLGSTDLGTADLGTTDMNVVVDMTTDTSEPMDMSSDTGAEIDATVDTAVAIDEGVDLGPPPDMGVWTCPAGNYVLESITCGTTDVTETYTAIVTTATVEVEHREDGTCHFRFVESNAGCMKEHWQHLGYPTSTHINANSYGITGCSPASCTLDAEDAACMTGADAGMTMEEVVEIDAESFQISTDAPYGYCGRSEMTQTTRWVRVEDV